MHPSSKLSESDLKKLKNYISSLVNVKKYDSLKTKEVLEQYTKWQESIGNNSYLSPLTGWLMILIIRTGWPSAPQIPTIMVQCVQYSEMTMQ